MKEQSTIFNTELCSLILDKLMHTSLVQSSIPQLIKDQGGSINKMVACKFNTT